MHAPVELADLPPVERPTRAGPDGTGAIPIFPLRARYHVRGLAGFVGYLDYLTGYEQSLLFFYLVSIAVATWFGGLYFGLSFSMFSVLVWVVSDLLAGIGLVSFWNLANGVSAYILFTFMLAKLRTLFSNWKTECANAPKRYVGKSPSVNA